MGGTQNEFVKRAFGRGESLVAGAGLSLGVMLLVGMGVLAWWQSKATVDASRSAAEDQAVAVMSTLAEASASLLANGDLSAVRRLAVDAGRHDAVADVQLVLGDGRVLAASQPSAIDTIDLGSSWPTLPGDAAIADGIGTLRQRIDVAGLGSGVLEIRVGAASLAETWETQAAVAGAGACLLGGLLVVYRSLRRRLAPLDAVRSALSLLARGEERAEVLRLSDALGEEAAAWNRLLDDRDTRVVAAVRERAGAALSGRGTPTGDLAEACDALWLGLIIVDEKRTIRYCNGASAIFLGGLRDEIRGKPLDEIVSDAGVLGAIEAIERGETKRRATVEVERSGESEGILRFGLRPIRRDEQTVTMILIEDITQQRVAEKARNHFVAQATHELRTPLTNIRLYVEEALDLDESEAAERSRCLNVINTETLRLERVVGDMLSVSEIEAGSLRLNDGDVRIDALVADLSEDYGAQAREKSITLVFDASPKLPVLRGDREKLAICLHNLVGNALKYTPSGGRVDVSIDADEGQLTFAVADTGIGISPDDQSRVFERFYRANDSRIDSVTGTGLGLALAREFARLHGGDITIESELDKGSTFTLAVPIRTQQDATAKAA